MLIRTEASMKCSVRSGVFETNSSSVHGVCVTNHELYNDFLNGSLIISSQVSDDQLRKLGLSRNKSYNPDDIADKINNSDEFKEILGIDKYCEVDLSSMKCSMREFMFYYGLWTLDGLKDSKYLHKIDETKSPNGEDIVVIGYYGWS